MRDVYVSHSVGLLMLEVGVCFSFSANNSAGLPDACLAEVARNGETGLVGDAASCLRSAKTSSALGVSKFGDRRWISFRMSPTW